MRVYSVEIKQLYYHYTLVLIILIERPVFLL